MPLIEAPDARFQPCMDSFLGALAGVLKALDDERPMAELWGLSALAFKIQIHRTLQPVGLLGRQWDETYPRIVRRLGYDCFAGLRDKFYTPKDLRELQFAWMSTIEKALEDGRPAIAFGLHGPAFGIIRALDNAVEEYHVSTFMDGRNDAPINAQDVGSLNPPLIFVLILTGPIADYDPRQAAVAALREAVDQHLGQEKDEKGVLLQAPADMAAGSPAYNAWSAAIETAQLQPYWAAGYYAAYYTEARSAAATWLEGLCQSSTWAPRQACFTRAAQHFRHEAESFAVLPKLFPMNQPETLQDAARRTEASACVRAARAEHLSALEALIEALELETGRRV